MIQINMEMPAKCADCIIEKQDVDSYTFADVWNIHYYCPFIMGNHKIYTINNKTDHVRNSKRHGHCPLVEIKTND